MDKKYVLMHGAKKTKEKKTHLFPDNGKYHNMSLWHREKETNDKLLKELSETPEYVTHTHFHN